IFYPSPPLSEDVEALLRRTPCMREAHALQMVGKREKAAEAFAGCADGTPAEQLLASDLAASQLLAAGDPKAAIRTLQVSSPPIQTELWWAVAEGLDPQRLVHRRLTLATALARTGRGVERMELLEDTVREITALSGAALAGLLPEARRLLQQELTGRLSSDVQSELQDLVDRATRRTAGYEEVRDRLSAIPPSPPPEEGLSLNFVHDMYSDPGFLLVWAPLGRDRVGAVHLDVETLVANLVREELRLGSDRPLAILDTQRHLFRPAGMDTTGTTVAADVPLGRMVPHLRLALLAAEEDDTPSELVDQVLELLPALIALLLAAVAIVVQQTASRRERELYKRQQDFIARVSHELKTPLAGIKVMAETLEMGAAADPESLQVFLRRILQETEKLEARIEEVLSAAKEPTVGATTPVELHRLAAEVIESWQPRFAQAGAAIEAELKPCPAVAADPELLRDAMSNLLDNALKYRREGTRGLAHVRTGEMGRWIVFEVSDNGIGVPVEMRRAIFERFQRVEGHGRGKAGGHGLGLAFVADTAAAHGGLVECSDGLHGGARFRLKLRRR
ncbi:MAG: HAMP domain-containing sensor histidine kinase, partial [Myxococcota bacterium]|nr:HAMP domain-containing sensor histidine kinase [Myxococcota bacterium]